MVPVGERSVEVSERAVSAEGRFFSVRVTERRWAVPPQRVLLHHTPIWVSIRSTADDVLRLEPEDWRLVTRAGEGIPAVALERLVGTGSGSLAETRLIRAQGLRPRSLQPGEPAEGFVFFRQRFDRSEDGEPVTLRILLRSADGSAPIVPLEIPLRIGR